MQGSLLDPNAVAEHMSLKDVTNNDVLVVISQSCDVVCESHELEPHVEVHIARAIDSVDGNNVYGKNPRVLDLDTVVNGTPRLLRIRQHEREKLPRSVLSALLPTGTLRDRDVDVLAKWTGNRYTRPALPDAFNARRAKVRDAITKVLKKDGRDMSGVYIALHTSEELPDDVDYRVTLLAVAPKAIADDPLRFQKVIDATHAVETILKAAPGIVVEEAMAQSAAAVSLEDISYFKRLEFEYITTRDGGEPATGVP